MKKIWIAFVLTCSSAAQALTFEQLNDQGLDLKILKTVRKPEAITVTYQFAFPAPRSGEVQTFTAEVRALPASKQIVDLHLADVKNLPAHQSEAVFGVLLRMSSLCMGFAPSGVSLDFMQQIAASQKTVLKFNQTYGKVQVSYVLDRGKLTQLRYLNPKPAKSNCTL